MKKTMYLIFVILLMLGMVACGAPAGTPASTSEPTIEPTSESVVVFTDTVLEELVRKAMNKLEGDITLVEAEAVTELDLQMEGGVPLPRVADVSDLKQFPNLSILNLNWALSDGENAIDISSLAGLTKLEYLYVCCDNITDVSALAGMTNMKELWIWGNNITDISALSGMTQMRSLWIKGNRINDISALADMKNLVCLYMEENQVTDYSPLADVYRNLEEKDFEMK